MFDALKGKKTFITGIVAIVTAVGALLAGDANIADTAQLVLTAVLGMTIRAGITNG